MGLRLRVYAVWGDGGADEPGWGFELMGRTRSLRSRLGRQSNDRFSRRDQAFRRTSPP